MIRLYYKFLRSTNFAVKSGVLNDVSTIMSIVLSSYVFAVISISIWLILDSVLWPDLKSFLIINFGVGGANNALLNLLLYFFLPYAVINSWNYAKAEGYKKYLNETTDTLSKKMFFTLFFSSLVIVFFTLVIISIVAQNNEQ